MLHTGIVNVRMTHDSGKSNDSGRVEVFLSGLDQWGIIYNKHWNDFDSTVVCRQMGFDSGISVPAAQYVSTCYK